MNRRLARRLPVALSILAFATAGAAQQPLPEGAQMPPGHPPVGSTASPPASAQPAGSATAAAPRPPGPVASGAALPPGHPPTGEEPAPMPEGHPPPTPSQGPPPTDRVAPAPELGAGTVEVAVADGNGGPQGGLEVVLRQHRHDVAEGDSTTELRGTTDASGRARFTNLPKDTSFSFTAHLTHGVAKYRSNEFQVHDGTGRRVELHVYPTERAVNRVLLGMRGVVLLEPREDVIQVEMSFQVFNIGRSTWVPESTFFPLPAGAKAFRAREASSEATVEHRDGRVYLTGTYAPGQHDVSFSFQVPATGEESQALDVHLPPHVVEVRVAAAMARSSTLSVAGFEEARQMRNQDGAWIALTGRQLASGERPMDRLEIRLAGLRVPSQGRWVAAGLAAALAAAGLMAALVRRGSAPARRSAGEDAERARELLFDELEALERLRQEERIGPRAYERNRGALVDALARLEASRAPSGAPGASAP